MTDDDALIARLNGYEKDAVGDPLSQELFDDIREAAGRIAALTAESARFAIKTALEITDLRRRATKAEAECDALRELLHEIRLGSDRGVLLTTFGQGLLPAIDAALKEKS